MKLSYNWIREYLQTDISPREMARIMTDIGLEVENMETFESVKGGLKGVVIGEVVTCEKHPGADKLSLTTVDVGNGILLSIVCGAPNVEAGQKVPVALPGAVLFQDDKSFEIKKTRIRGEISEGMICAEDELGLGTDHSGIMVLDPSARPGTPASEYFQLCTDTVFEVGLTPNRIDGGSHYGAARDLAAWFSIRNKAKLILPPVEAFKPDNHELPIDVRIEDEEACPRYAGVTLTGVKVGSSPLWLQYKLRSIGLTPVNNVVDITNFVLHETGQPLHAFDADRIEGETVVVKKMPGGTRFVTLDEVERELSEEDLMICNTREPMCIGGVFGGQRSGVTETTTRVFLESAWFNPLSIRKTARRHGLNTDASFHFERGADPRMTLYALKRAALLVKEIAGAKISSDIIDRYPRPIPDHTVEFSFERTARLIGKQIEPETIISILKALEIEILEKNADGLKTRVPAYRVDVTREADLVEEVLRIYGYNQVESPPVMRSSLSYAEKPDPDRVRNKVADMLAASGYTEIMSNSLTSHKYYSKSKSFPEEKCVRLYNPLSQDLDVMRQTLLFGGLETIRHNQNRQQNDLKLFEFGHIYFMNDPRSSRKDFSQYLQEERLGIWITGKKEPLNWHRKEETASFFTLKSVAEKVLVRLGIDPGTLEQDHSSDDLFEEGTRYLHGGKALLTMGNIPRRTLRETDIRGPVYYADFNWGYVLELFARQHIRFTGIPRFPEVRRDLALVLDREVPFSRVYELSLKTEKKLLKSVNLFDVYEGPQVEKGKKSYAVSFVLQDENKTLTDKQIDQVMARLLKSFEKELGAKLR
ncbi:MAG: phenylalanine--tRNA ligase subunit beta [Bacteroidales bacterium]